MPPTDDAVVVVGTDGTIMGATVEVRTCGRDIGKDSDVKGPLLMGACNRAFVEFTLGVAVPSTHC